MFWDEYIYDEKMDFWREGVTEGAAQFERCLKCVYMRYTDPEIAAELGENLEDVQGLIDKARRFAEEFPIAR